MGMPSWSMDVRSEAAAEPTELPSEPLEESASVTWLFVHCLLTTGTHLS